MAELLFERKCVVAVDEVEVSNLRVTFTVTKTLGKEPNTCELAVSNLSKATRALLQGKGSKVLLQAGHTETIATIFAGDARTIEHVSEGPTVVSRIRCGDGERAYQFAWASESYSPGVRAQDVAAYLVGRMGLLPGNALSKVRDYRGPLTEFAHGYSLHGKASAEFDRLMSALGFTWSVQDGALQVLNPHESNEQTAVVLDSDSGLVGSPEHGTPEKKGRPSVMKCKSILMPEFRPGRRVILNARDTKGTYRIQKVTHRGDSEGGDWFSELECLPA